MPVGFHFGMQHSFGSPSPGAPGRAASGNLIPLASGQNSALPNTDLISDWFTKTSDGRIRGAEFWLAPIFAVDGDYSDVATVAAGGSFDGRNVPLRVDPEGYGTQVGATDLYHALALGSGASVRNLVLDGEKGDLSTSLTSMGFRGVQFIIGATNVSVRDVNIVDVPSVGGIESFAINTSAGSEDGVFERLTISRTAGTALHFRGDWNDNSVDGPALRHTVDTATLSGNDWHGMSVFGAFDCAATDVVASTNGEYGVNIEFGGCDVDGLTASGNGNGGVRVMGDSEGSLQNATLSGNNTDESDYHAEICIQSNEWTIGLETPERWQPSSFDFYTDTISITPRTGLAHVRSRGSNAVTNGSPAPSGMRFHGAACRAWKFAYEDPTGALGSNHGYDRFGPGMEFPDLLTAGTELAVGSSAGQLPALSAWLTSSATFTAYSDADPNTPADARLLKATAQFGVAYPSNAPLVSSSDYLVFFKWKPLSATDEYVFNNNNTQTQTMRLRLGQRGVDLNQWFEGYMILKNGNGTRPQFLCTTATASISANGVIIGGLRIWKLP